MIKAFIHQFASSPPPGGPLDNSSTATGTITYTREDGDRDDPFCSFGDTLNARAVGTMTSTVNSFEGPEQDKSMPLCGIGIE